MNRFSESACCSQHEILSRTRSLNFGLLRQSCNFGGLTSQMSLLQTMTLTAHGLTGTLSMSSFFGNGAIGASRINGVVQPSL